ncbi:MAG: hypothetical protein LC798_13515 [Chloroflexi bacterium]|nr:hypothetical protein [Chloroflexota bacterium]
MRPPKGAYHAALLAARRREFAIRARSARDMARAIEAYADSLHRQLLALRGVDPGSARAAREAERIARAAAREMYAVAQRAIAGHRRASYNEVLEVWRDAQARAARSVGVDLALLRFGPPRVSMLGVFEAVGSPQTWRSLLLAHSGNAAGEVAQVVRLGFGAGIGPDEMARRIRSYVKGSEPFAKLFTDVPTETGTVAKVDLRRVPADLRGAAQQMRYNAERIAVSENHAAKWEAEIQAHQEDPFTEAVQWELNPSHDVYDECDVLAEEDFYGLGPGVFPVDAVPAPPHPFDGCSTMAVLRDSARIGDPKPSPAVRPVEIRAPGGTTEAKARAVERSARSAVRQGRAAIQAAA